jgi:hypothetical protein
MTKKIDKYEDWITAHDAALLLSKKLGRPVSPKYIRTLAKSKRQPVRTRPLRYHQLYNRDDILASKISQTGKQAKRKAST